jgi:hypothetical protein
MDNKTLEKWAWLLLYGGLLLAVLGLFVQPRDTVSGSLMTIVGGVAAVAGAGMIWWRSRRKE